MQNVVNYMCPFFRNGMPIVNGRVYFLKQSTSAQTFSDIEGLDGAYFIPVKDKDGTRIENPLQLNAEGRFSVQPFVDDGVNFKMVVCYPTGVPADINDESMTYDVAYTINAFAQGGEIIDIGGVATVDSIADLRQLEPTVKAALVLGYSAAGDFCHPRLFNWVETLKPDNNGTKIRSTVQGYTASGTWECAPSGFVDVRWFGANPDNGMDCTSIILAVAQEFTTLPIYFPAGAYYLSSHVSAKSVIMDRLAIFYPADGIEGSIVFSVENSFENRGGRFESNENSLVYPKVKGTLRTSWLSSPMDDALSSSALANVDEIIFDANKTVSEALTIDKKRILVKDGITVDDAITFAPTCSVYYEADGMLTAALAKLGIDWNFVPLKDANIDELNVKKGDSTLFKFTESLLYAFAEMIFVRGLKVDSTNFWKTISDPQSAWNGILALIADRAKFGALLASYANISEMSVNRGEIASMMRFNDDCTVIVDEGYLKYLDSSPFARSAITDNTINVKSSLLDWYDHPDNMLINIVIIKASDVLSSENFTLLLPNEESNVVINVSNLNNRGLAIFETDAMGTPSASVKVLGCSSSGISRLGSGPDHVVLRKPSAEERTRYGIDSSVHWIIDPHFV